MERIFYTMELMAGVSNLVLAFFLHFSRLPRPVKNHRKLHARTCLEAAYVIIGGLSLAVAFAEGHVNGSLGDLKAFFIQGISPLQVLLLSWAFLLPIYTNERIDRLMGGQLTGALLLLIANTVYYFGFHGQPGTVVAYVLLGIYVMLAAFCVALFIKLGGDWEKLHPERVRMMRTRVYPLWIGLGVLTVLSVAVSLFPNLIFQFVFTGMYTLFYFIFALKYHNSMMADAESETKEKPSETTEAAPQPAIIACDEKEDEPQVVKVHVDDYMDKSMKVKYVDIGERLGEWISAKHYLHAGVTIQGLSKSIGVNRTYLSNYINETYHMNFNTWMNRLRIDEAKRRIVESTTGSLAEIAEEVGFADLAHFSKQFKLLEGMSPSVYRKNIREMNEMSEINEMVM